MPALPSPSLLRLSETEPAARGYQRGAELRTEIADGIALYLRLFRLYEADESVIREMALRSLDAAAKWNVDLANELTGVANGAGCEPWHIAALNARTEILAAMPGARPGECTTLAHVGARAVGSQTWDWHEELAHLWHLQEVRSHERGFVGLTEHGILAKIGVNDAGLAVLFNILGHRDDSATGLPLHLLAWEVLTRAASVDEALEIIRLAPVSASSALTLIDQNRGVTVEVSPAGKAEIPAGTAGWISHSNHFLAPHLATGEKPGLYDPDSQDRLALVHKRVDGADAPSAAGALLSYLESGPGEPAICCSPSPGARFGDRWRTLATVLTDSARRTLTVSAGSPVERATTHPIILHAPATQHSSTLPTM